MVFIVIGLFSLFFTLNRANIVGFEKAQIIIPMCAAILFLILFIINELRSKHPLIDFDLLKNPVYTSSVLMRIGVGASFFSILFVLAIYLQHILDFTPVMAGVYYLPMTIIMGIIPPFFGRIQKCIGALIPVYLGMLLIIISLTYFNLLNLTEFSFGKIFLTLFLFGLGIGLILPSNIIIALQDVSKRLMGLGVGLLYTCILLSGTTLVIFSTIIIKDYGTRHARYELRKDRVALTPTQDIDLQNAVTGLKASTDFAKEFSVPERPLVSQAIRYGFEQAFFLILRVCILICTITLVIFWIVQRIKHKKSLLLPDKEKSKKE